MKVKNRTIPYKEFEKELDEASELIMNFRDKVNPVINLKLGINEFVLFKVLYNNFCHRLILEIYQREKVII